MTIDTQKLRDLIHQACPLPWSLATSNSWRRIVDRFNGLVCQPCNQPDGHPDLAFHGGAEGSTAQLLIEGINALPDLLDLVETQADQIAEYARIAEETRTAADSRIDAQAAENTALREALGECREVLQIIAQPGWLSDALQSGGVARLSREVSAIKRQARAALSGESK